MAQPELDSFKRRGLAIALSGTLPTSSGHSMQILDGSSERQVDSVERNIDKPYFGNNPSSKKNRRAMIMGTIEITPPSAPGQPTTGVASTAPALLSAAMAQTLTADSRLSEYNVLSTGLGLYEAIWWHSGTYVHVTKGRADLSEIKMEIGERFTAKWSFEGVYTEVTEVALPTDFDYSDFPVPTVAEFDNTTLILNSLGTAAITALHLRAKRLSASYGLEKGVKEYTEYKETRVTERKGTFTCLFARPDLDDFNPTAIRDSGEFITLSFITRETDGRYSELFVRGQIDDVKDADIEGDFGYEITGRLIPSSAGNDEVAVNFGDETFALNGTLNGGTVGVAYVADGLVASGLYTAPLAWTVSVGTLPTGLAINATTGVITGTPSGSPGTSNITIRAEDSDAGTNLVATKAVSIVIS
jgi:hypothetical protein